MMIIKKTVQEIGCGTVAQAIWTAIIFCADSTTAVWVAEYRQRLLREAQTP
jgi:hypothetical protein